MNKPISIGVAPAIAARFPDILVGGFLIHGLAEVADRFAGDIFRSSRAALEKEGLNIQRLAEDPRIHGWREAIARCGLKPSTYKSSPEQLARRLLKGSSVSTPFPAVNLYCAVSVRHLAPMGGYDVNRLPEDTITLRFPQQEGDRFLPLGASSEDMPLGPDVASYASGNEIICWAFNHRDSRMTSIQADTQSAIFISEAVTGAQADATHRALEELAGLLASAGAQVGEIAYVDRENQLAQLAWPALAAAAAVRT